MTCQAYQCSSEYQASSSLRSLLRAVSQRAVVASAAAGQRSDRGRRAEAGENAFAGDHLQEIVIPGRVVAFRFQGRVTLGLKKAAHGQQCAASRLVVMSGIVGGGIKEQHDSVTPGGRRGGCVYF